MPEQNLAEHPTAAPFPGVKGEERFVAGAMHEPAFLLQQFDIGKAGEESSQQQGLP